MRRNLPDPGTRSDRSAPGRQLLESLASISRHDLMILSRPAVCVDGTRTCETVEAEFRRDETLTSVAVIGEGGRVGMITRGVIGDVMTGRFGYGRVLNSHREVGREAFWSPLVVDVASSVESVATQVVMREERRWDDILVRTPQGLRVASAAAVLQTLAGAFAVRANHDDLTGLPNRSMFYSLTETACAKSHGSDALMAVLYIDLDGFKQVNDTRGHNAGDATLVAAAKQLTSAVRDGDIVARLGGDEFAVLVELPSHGRDPQPTSVAERAAAIGDRYGKALAAGSTLRASIGVAVCDPSFAADAESLLREADLAMYSAKRAGGNRVVVTDRVGGVHLILGPRGQLAPAPDLVARLALQEAITTDQLVLHFQPIVQLSDHSVASIEALVRWQHPVRGLLGPDEFFADAERFGLLADLDDWVLDRAIRMYSSWCRDTTFDVSFLLNVNMSRASLARPDLVELVTSALRRHDVPAGRLRIELVEDAETDLLNEAAPRLAALREHGVSLAWDDMGTGASSLKHITQLPVDGLKIDRTFVAEMHGSPSALAVVRMLIHLADSLQMSVTAEGVETHEQLTTLTTVGAGYAQGYYFARPAPPDQFVAWFREWTEHSRTGWQR